MSENTFTVYLLTLSEAGFKEETILNCWYGRPIYDSIERPDGTFLDKYGLDKVSITGNNGFHFYSLDPDFGIGKRAIKAELQRRLSGLQSLSNICETGFEAAEMLSDGSLLILNGVTEKDTNTSYALFQFVMDTEAGAGKLSDIRKAMIREIKVNGEKRKVLTFFLPEAEVPVLAGLMMKYLARKSGSQGITINQD